MFKANGVIGSYPGDLVCLDLMGPLPVSRGRVTQLLVIVNAFSKLVKLYALKRATAKVILKVLVQRYFPEAGQPKSILTDNGIQFRSHVWLETLESAGIRVVHTSVYIPQGNMTERVNREISRLIRSFYYSQHSKWAVFLKDIDRCLNNTIHESTGYSPNELHFGTSRVHPFEKWTSTPPLFTLNPKAVLLARETLKARVKKRQNLSNSKGKIEIGDRFLIRSHPISSAENRKIRKFFSLYEGPYVVQARVDPNVYQIYDEDSGVDLGVQNVINLKRYLPPVNVL